jgi:hypothetical protein
MIYSSRDFSADQTAVLKYTEQKFGAKFNSVEEIDRWLLDHSKDDPRYLEIEAMRSMLRHLWKIEKH